MWKKERFFANTRTSRFVCVAVAYLHTPIHSGSGRCGAGAVTSSLSIQAPRITNDSPPSFAEFGVFYPPTFLVIPCVRLMAGLKTSMVTPGCLGQGWTLFIRFLYIWRIEG